jgi:hypothetical protein
VVEIAAVVVPADREPTTFEASLLAYSELVHDLGVGQASLEELIGARGARVEFSSPSTTCSIAVAAALLRAVKSGARFAASSSADSTSPSCAPFSMSSSISSRSRLDGH